MSCQTCGETFEGDPDACPACGAVFGASGCIERAAGGTASGRLVTDGGRPPDGDDDAAAEESSAGQSAEDEAADGQSTDDETAAGEPTVGQSSEGQSTGGQSTSGQSTGGQSTGGQSTGGQSTGDRSTGGQSTGGQSAGGQSTGGQSAGGQSTGGQSAGGRSSGGQAAGQPNGGQATAQANGGRHAGGATTGQGRANQSDVDPSAVVDALPLWGGTITGLFATLTPYVLITVATIVPLQREQFQTSAELYATIVGFGPGRRFVDLFVGGTDVSALGNVRPSDYPSMEAELGAALETILTNPEALLLPLYLLSPLVAYFGGRHLARKHASGESPLEHAAVGVPMALGGLLVTVPITLAFGVGAQVGAVLVGGLFAPLCFGGLGGLTVYAFRDVSWIASKAYGWLAAVLAIVVSIALFPLLLSGGVIEIDAGQRVLFGLMGFLASSSLRFPLVLMGFLMLALVVACPVGVGYLLVRRSDQAPADPLVGARLGTSVALGYVPAAALVLVLLPFLSLVVDLPFGMGAQFASVMPDVGGFFANVVRVTVFALGFGALGGALAAFQRRHGDPTA